MTQREKTLKRFKETVSAVFHEDPQFWHMFKKFYELGVEDTKKEIRNPFPDSAQAPVDWSDEELQNFNELLDKPENLQDFN
jgi:hypothetical protein